MKPPLQQHAVCCCACVCVCVCTNRVCVRSQTRGNFEETSKQTETLMKKMMEVRQMVSSLTSLYDCTCTYSKAQAPRLRHRLSFLFYNIMIVVGAL